MLTSAAAAAAGACLALAGPAWGTAPANDNIANAQVLSATLPTTAVGTNVGATAEANEPRRVDFLDRPASTVWYEWTSPAQPAQLTVDACQGATYHMKLAIYKKVADPVPPFGNLVDKGAVGEDPGPNAGCSGEYGAAGVITPEACSTYYIQISGFAATAPPDGDRGPFVLKLSGGGTGSCDAAAAPPPPPPPATTTPTKKKKGAAAKKKCKKAKKGVASAAKKCKKKK